MFVDPELPEDLKNKPINSSALAAADFSNPAVIPETVQLGDVTEHELRAYDGSDPNKPLLMAIKGEIYDVSRSRYITSILFFVSAAIFLFELLLIYWLN